MRSTKTTEMNRFRDVAFDHGVAEATRFMSGWGLKFFDFDNDGYLDLFVANGHPDDMIESYRVDIKYREPMLLFHNDGDRLRDITSHAGPVFQKAFSARGLAVGDFDNDGRTDVVVANNGQPPLLLKNNSGKQNHWVGIRLVGVACNRDATGARISWSVNGMVHSRLKSGGGSYLSSHDPREVIGLGSATDLEWVEVRWPLPSAKVERFKQVPIDRYIRIEEGKGIVEQASGRRGVIQAHTQECGGGVTSSHQQGPNHHRHRERRVRPDRQEPTNPELEVIQSDRVGATIARQQPPCPYPNTDC